MLIAIDPARRKTGTETNYFEASPTVAGPDGRELKLLSYDITFEPLADLPDPVPAELMS